METIRIYCVNDGQWHEVPHGADLRSIAEEIFGRRDGRIYADVRINSKRTERLEVLAATVNNRLKSLDFCIELPDSVEFITYNSLDGKRTYIRSLLFVLQKAVRELFPDKILIVDYSLPSGHYCEIREKTPREDGSAVAVALTVDQLQALSTRMQEIIDADLRFGKVKMPSEEAIGIFEANSQMAKADLVRTRGVFNTSVYTLGQEKDSFHGPLLWSTGQITKFAVVGFGDGFCLQYPDGGNTEIAPMKSQTKIAATLKRHSTWCSILGIRGLGSLNQSISEGRARELINLCEARHERCYAEIADRINQKRHQIRIVFIAGPSSSGKTSTSLRLALQCRVLGMNPKVIELDNYFLDREHTPRDEDGNYDFEALEAMDLALLNSQLNDLLDGKTVEIPKFNFKTGAREKGKTMTLGEKDILIMEGIHALNPAMVSGVDNSRIFRVYASALTSLSVDENNNISTSDNRLLRRMVRDNRVRGINPEQTILRWPSVRRGENRNIFPFQENADAEFNSSLLFELPMLRYYAEPLLRRIPPHSPAYSEASRLLKFLDYILPLAPDEIAAIPPTSIMREFIGGQTL